MRNVIVMMSVSLDGFIEGPNGELDWHMVDDELHSQLNERLGAMGAFLYGRVDLALGGADIAAAFKREDLIDEYRLYVHPVVIGRGKPLFQPSDTKIDLHLAETRPFGNGVVPLRYQRPTNAGWKRDEGMRRREHPTNAAHPEDRRPFSPVTAIVPQPVGPDWALGHVRDGGGFAGHSLSGPLRRTRRRPAPRPRSRAGRGGRPGE